MRSGSSSTPKWPNSATAERRRAAPLALPGLDPDSLYIVRIPPPQLPSPRAASGIAGLFGEGIAVPGALLATAGLTLPDLWPDSAIVLEAVREGPPP